MLDNVRKRLPDGTTVYRIIALRDFGNIKAGTRGGFIAAPENLSHKDNCWVADEAIASGFSQVKKDAVLSGCARLYGFAWIGGNASVSGNAIMTDYTSAYDNAVISGHSILRDGASVFENGSVKTAFLKGRAAMQGKTTVRGNASIIGFGSMRDNSTQFQTSCDTFRKTISPNLY